MYIKDLYIVQQLGYFKQTLLNAFNLCYIKIRYKNRIIVNSWVLQRWGKVIPNNFGDDINEPIIEALTGMKMLAYNCLFSRKKPNLLCIGSIIESHCTSQSVIWGSGILYGTTPLRELPKAVYAVRGKLTHDYLISLGIECPQIYGDPALLLPYIYNKKISTKYTYGIIPHYTEIELLKNDFALGERKDVKIIDLVHYNDWKDIIDEIRACKYILSSSLHGLIVSDAYKIPNVHVLFSNSVNGGDLKYKDYYSGVGKKYIEPIDFKRGISFEEVQYYLDNYEPLEYDIRPLLKSFPFKLTEAFSNY